MEGPPVLGPSRWQRRRSWLRQSRGWRSPAPRGDRDQEEEEEEEEQEVPAVTWETSAHLHDAVPKGNLCSEIQMWLQDCGAAALEEPGLPGGPCACGSFGDNLTLGAEALLPPGSLQASGSVPPSVPSGVPSPLRARRDQRLNLGDSMTSGVPPGVPPGVPTGSSLSQVLSWWHRDAEEILHDLGFVGTEPGVASRVPPRFFSAPSRASGIDLRLFLRAQARRLRMEDPCLLLAGRFQQLQALAASADAFFCLYHYVSRTPPQRSSPPRPCRDMPDMAPPGPCPKRAGGSGLGSRCHPRVTATAGGHRGGPPGVSSGLAPPGAAESFEMEEVRRRRRGRERGGREGDEEEEEEEMKKRRRRR